MATFELAISHGSRAGFRSCLIVFDGAAGHTDRADNLTGGIFDRHTTREGDQALIGVLNVVERTSGLS